ncbi:MAG: DUF2066 domain-containing protein [Sneathiella sp.]
MTETKQVRTLHTLRSLMIVGIFLFGIKAAVAQSNDVFLVKGISVDVTAASASEARTIAVAAGQQRAFKALLRKLTPKSYHGDLPELPDSELTPMVAGFQVSKEKTSATRYLADLSYEFRASHIRPILQARSIPYAETRSKPLLVLPVFDMVGSKNLWDEPNPWRDAWIGVFERGEGPEGSQRTMDDWAQDRIVPVIVASGTLEDIRTVTVEDAVGLNAEALADIADLYGAGSVLIAYASLQKQGEVRRLDISYQRNDLISPAVVESFTGGDTDRDIFRAAIFDVVENLQESWKDQNVLDRSIENKLAVSSRISSLREWMQIQRKAKSVPAIQDIKIRELSVEKAFWEISFVGEISQLTGALAQRDLFLRNIEGYWTLNTNLAE